MTKCHKSSILFCEQTAEVQAFTLKHHHDFYNSTGAYKDEVAYKLCKCTNLPQKTTRAALYVHSLEASHYPLIQCAKCHVLMEREDSKEHSMSECNPLAEGSYFLQAMEKAKAAKLARKNNDLINIVLDSNKNLPSAVKPDDMPNF